MFGSGWRVIDSAAAGACLMRQIVGKRLTWNELIGKVETPESSIRPA